MKTHNEILSNLNACKEAREFSKNYPDAEAAWDNCPRGDWMLWIAKKLNVDKRKLILAKGLCAQTVIHLMKDERSRKAVQAAIDYGNGLINDQELRDSADAAASAVADAAASAAYAVADAYAASAAAAYAAAAVADAYAASAAAAYAASAAADYAAYASDYAAYAAAYARKRNQQITADICREILTDEVLTAYKNLAK